MTHLLDVDTRTSSFWCPRTMACPTAHTIQIWNCACNRENAMHSHWIWLVLMVYLVHAGIATIARFDAQSCPLALSVQLPKHTKWIMKCTTTTKNKKETKRNKWQQQRWLIIQRLKSVKRSIHTQHKQGSLKWRDFENELLCVCCILCCVEFDAIEGAIFCITNWFHCFLLNTCFQHITTVCVTAEDYFE